MKNKFFFVSMAAILFLGACTGSGSKGKQLFSISAKTPKGSPRQVEIRTADVIVSHDRYYIMMSDLAGDKILDYGEWENTNVKDPFHRLRIQLTEIPKKPGEYSVKNSSYGLQDDKEPLFNYGWSNEKVDGNVVIKELSLKEGSDVPAKISGHLDIKSSNGAHFSGDFVIQR